MPLDSKQLTAIREATTEPALRAARDLLLAEVERLREALRKIAKLAADREAFMLLGPRAFAQAERIALAALAPDAAKEG